MRQELNGILAFVGILWAVFAVSLIPGLNLNDHFGLIPRSAEGLPGIFAMPFLHGSFSHLLNNTVPLVVLLMLLFSSRTHPIGIILCLVILSGSMLWLFGRNTGANGPMGHIGASGLIYALIAFLIMAGILERKMVPLAISVLVGFLYGGTLIWGVFPISGENISWDGHLMGAVAGGVFAWATVKRKPRAKKPDRALNARLNQTDTSAESTVITG